MTFNCVFGFPHASSAIYAKGMMLDIEAVVPFKSKKEAIRYSEKLMPNQKTNIYHLVALKSNPIKIKVKH